ncbi:response regulator transcription factor [Bradyrhizobium sp.]|jgi:two-component system, LuxR family, response regulator FixJ|uniref:response regulator transcription factor n=1 Tax=Bradyrhizobium sp. TaxID=376 RepID=UPI003C13FE24
MSLGKIFALEDDAADRGAISLILMNAGYQPVCFADGDTLLVNLRQRHPVCILLDLQLPGKSGLDILSELRDRNYPAPILIISGYGNIELAVRVLKLGAADFIEKPFDADELIRRIKSTLQVAPPGNSSAELPTKRDGWCGLTKREVDILSQISLEKTAKEISRQLGLSPRTVEDHLANMMKKADVKSTTKLLLKFLQSQ